MWWLIEIMLDVIICESSNWQHIERLTINCHWSATPKLLQFIQSHIWIFVLVFCELQHFFGDLMIKRRPWALFPTTLLYIRVSFSDKLGIKFMISQQFSSNFFNLQVLHIIFTWVLQDGSKCEEVTVALPELEYMNHLFVTKINAPKKVGIAFLVRTLTIYESNNALVSKNVVSTQYNWNSLNKHPLST